MKSKYTTYFLLIALFVVWGVIIWRVFLDHQTEEFKSETVSATEVRKSSDGAIRLTLSYRDPFVEAEQMVQVADVSPEPIETVREELDFIYKGRIRCAGSVYYMISSNGVIYNLVGGDQIDDFRLINGTQDSLCLMKKGLRYTLKLSD